MHKTFVFWCNLYKGPEFSNFSNFSREYLPYYYITGYIFYPCNGFVCRIFAFGSSRNIYLSVIVNVYREDSGFCYYFIYNLTTRTYNITNLFRIYLKRKDSRSILR